MESNKIFKFAEYSYNFTMKLVAKPKQIKLRIKKNKLGLKKHEDKATIILLLILFVTVTTWLLYHAINQEIVGLKIAIVAIATLPIYYSILTFGSVIIAFNLDFPFELKTYDYKVENNQIIEVETPSPLLKRLRNNKESKNEEIKNEKCVEKEIDLKNRDVINNFNSTNINQFNNVPINDTNKKKEKSDSDNSKKTKQSGVNQQKPPVEINYLNRPQKRSGPGGNFYKYLALKYFLIQRDYPEQRVGVKYHSEEEFFKTIGDQEKINPGSLKTQYYKVKNENFEKLLNSYSNIIILLHQNNEFNKYPITERFVKNLI